MIRLLTLILLTTALAGCSASSDHKMSGTIVSVMTNNQVALKDASGDIHNLWFWNFSCPDLRQIVHPGDVVTFAYAGDDDDAKFHTVRIWNTKEKQ
jgi:hypothetical protein